MPVAFIFLVILMLFILVYKNVKLLKMPRIMLLTIITLLLCGFFISPISVNYLFSVNVLFAFCTLILASDLWIRLIATQKIATILLSVFSVAIYFLLITINNDYYSFLNYVPVIILVSGLSLVFIKNINSAICFILFSYLSIEWFNYFYTNSNICYLVICNHEFLNAVVISASVIGLLHLVFKHVKVAVLNNKKYREVNYEKK